MVGALYSCVLSMKSAGLSCIPEQKCGDLFEKGKFGVGRYEVPSEKGKGFRAPGQVVEVRCTGTAVYLNVGRWAPCQIMQTQLYLKGF